MKKFFLTSLLSLSLFLMLGFSVAESLVNGGNVPPFGEANTPTSGEPNTPPTGGSNVGPLSVSFKIDNPFGFRGGDSLYGLVENIVNKIILPIGGVLCVLAFIYAGFMYVTARGDTGQIKTAHTALLYASIGTAVLLGAWVIANAIRATINELIS